MPACWAAWTTKSVADLGFKSKATPAEAAVVVEFPLPVELLAIEETMEAAVAEAELLEFSGLFNLFTAGDTD